MSEWLGRTSQRRQAWWSIEERPPQTGQEISGWENNDQNLVMGKTETPLSVGTRPAREDPPPPDLFHVSSEGADRSGQQQQCGSMERHS